MDMLSALVQVVTKDASISYICDIYYMLTGIRYGKVKCTKGGETGKICPKLQHGMHSCFIVL